MSKTEHIILSDVIHKYQLEYGRYVIAELFPHEIDGLKSVARRSLWALRNDHNHFISSIDAISKISKYHIHSTDSTYESLIRLCQPFSILYPLFDLDGDIGSYSGDKSASYRYTSIKMSEFGYDMYFKDIHIPSLEFKTAENLKDIEPQYLIPKLPMTLLLHTKSIGYGMSSCVVGYKLSNPTRRMYP
jgi:DNA gyrase/topoisomerase IV subunit A